VRAKSGHKRDMADTTTAIDLSQLPAPTVVETLDLATIRAEIIAELVATAPTFNATVPSDPAVKLIDVVANRELLLRQKFNERALQLFLAYATGTNLDHLGALLGVARLTDELDDDFRYRIQLAPDSFSVAGPETAYKFHALSADATLSDASATSPAPGEVLVSLLSATGNGTATPSQIATVLAALNGKCPLTDLVTVQSGQIINYAITGQLTLFDGPDATTVLAAAQANADAYVAAARKLGRDINRAAILAAICVSGVSNVALPSPAADLPMDKTQAGHCTGITLTVAGRGE
jgi:phage-related baseplate assembly protein